MLVLLTQFNFQIHARFSFNVYATLCYDGVPPRVFIGETSVCPFCLLSALSHPSVTRPSSVSYLVLVSSYITLTQP